MKRILFTAGLTIISQFTIAQENPISPFTNLKVYDNINVTLVSSSSYKSEVTGENASDIQFLSSGKELKVRMNAVKILGGNKTNVTLYFKDLNSIQASQGAKVTSNSTIKSDKLDLVSNEGSSIDVSVKADVLQAKVNTGGSIRLEGKAESQIVNVSTGGEYSAENFKTEIANITVNAGGKAIINATKSSEAKVRAGGTIDIYGSPKVRTDKKVIGGRINYID